MIFKIRKIYATTIKIMWKKTVKSLFHKHVLATNIISSGILMGLGDMIQQEIEYSRKLKPNRIDYDRLARMFIVGFIEGPLHHVYYVNLDRMLPGMDLVTVAYKIMLDQVVASPMFIATFFYGMGLQEGKTLQECTTEVRNNVLTVYMADWFVWPPTQFINFYLIPGPYRIFYINAVTMLYNVFLSFVKHKDSHELITKTSCDPENLKCSTQRESADKIQFVRDEATKSSKDHIEVNKNLINVQKSSENVQLKENEVTKNGKDHIEAINKITKDQESSWQKVLKVIYKIPFINHNVTKSSGDNIEVINKTTNVQEISKSSDQIVLNKATVTTQLKENDVTKNGKDRIEAINKITKDQENSWQKVLKTIYKFLFINHKVTKSSGENIEVINKTINIQEISKSSSQKMCKATDKVQLIEEVTKTNTNRIEVINNTNAK